MSRYEFDYLILFFVIFFFFKQKTAYEMRISDWSSDVCSSDLRSECAGVEVAGDHGVRERKVTVRADIGVARVGVERRKDEVAAVFDADGLCAGKIGRASCRERVCQYV